MSPLEYLLSSTKFKKIKANLIHGLEAEKRRGVLLTEYRFIGKLPASQLELFNTLYRGSGCSCRAHFAIDIMQDNKINWIVK